MRAGLKERSFLIHQVRVKIEGFRPERLVNQGLNQGVKIKDIVYVDETQMRLTLSKDDYELLKKIAKSTFKITIINRRGIKPTREYILRHKLLPIGICIFIMYFSIQGMFIREIDIQGLSSIPEEKVAALLKSQGLYKGALKRFNCKEIEKRLFQDFNTIVWADVAYEGQYAQVRIAENTQFPKEKKNKNKPCNIIAEKSGYIEEIRTYNGKAKVKPGNFVKKGKVLIKGKVPIEYSSYQPTEDDPSYYYVHAEGIVKARIPYYFSFIMGKNGTKKLALQRLNTWIKENIPQKAQIINKSLNFTKKENIIRVYGIIETREKIGIEKEILVDKGNGRTKKDNN